MSDSVLALTYCFPPMGIPEAYLSTKTLGNLENFDVTLYTCKSWKSWMRKDPSLVEYSESKFSSIRRFGIPSVLERVPLTKMDLPLASTSPGTWSFKSWLIHLASPFAVPFLRVPDPFVIANRSLLKRILSDEISYKYLVTWSQYHSIQLVGAKLKKRLGKKIKWVAYFGDPWVANPYSANGFFVELVNKRLERTVFNCADVLIFPTKEMLEFCLDRYPDRIKSKGRVVSHAFDSSLFPNIKEIPAKRKFIFRYIGQFYGIRTPEIIYDSLLTLLSREPNLADEFSFEIVGNNNKYDFSPEKYALLPEGMVTFKSQINYLDSLKLMTETDCLVSIDAPATLNIFLSAKVIDYIGAKRPIVAFTSAGTTSDVVASYGGWIADSADRLAGAQAFERALHWCRTNSMKEFGNSEIRSRFEVSSVSRAFSTILREDS